MPIKQNAPARLGEGVGCLLGGDTDDTSTNSMRRQAVLRRGVPSHRADLIAGLAFGGVV